MLSISAIKSAASCVQYFESEQAVEYYTRHPEALGRWWGAAAAVLGVAGELVTPAQLRAVLEGRHPLTGERMVQSNANRQPGWDLTFSAPKSFSVLVLVAGVDLVQLHRESVDETMSVIQSNAGLTRRGKGGLMRERAGLISAFFEHHVNRNTEPQLHTHVATANLCVRSDGTTGTILSKPLYDIKMEAGRLYQTTLGNKLRARGYDVVTQADGTIRLAGVPQAIVDAFSTRRKEVLEELERTGDRSARAAAAAAVKTRKPKQKVSHDELLARWRKQVVDLGYAVEDLDRMARQTTQGLQREIPTGREVSEARLPAAQTLPSGRMGDPREAEGHALKGQTARVTAEQQGSVAHVGVSASRKTGPIIAQSPRKQGIVEATRPRQRGAAAKGQVAEDARQIKKFIKSAGRLAGRNVAGVSPAKQEAAIAKLTVVGSPLWAEVRHHAGQVLKAVRKKPTRTPDRATLAENAGQPLTPDQVAVVRALTGRGGQVRFLDGMGGSGKTVTLRGVADVYGAAKFTVIAVGPHQRAASELERRTGIPAYTVKSLERRTSFTLAEWLLDKSNQVVRAYQRKKPTANRLIKLDGKTVLLVDDANRLLPDDLLFIQRLARKSGARIIYSGDSTTGRALAGRRSGFAEAVAHVEASQLGGTRRAADALTRAFVHETRTDNIVDLFGRAELQGKLSYGDARKSHVNKMFTDWIAVRPGHRERAMLICSSGKTAKELNKRAQLERLMADEFTNKTPLATSSELFYEGDRVQFRTTSVKAGYRAGQIGTITRLAYPVLGLLPGKALIRLDDGRKVNVSFPRNNPPIELAYASTAARAAGVGVDTALILVEGHPERQRNYLYSTVSRVNKGFKLYADRPPEKEPSHDRSERDMPEERLDERTPSTANQRERQRREEAAQEYSR